MATKKEQNIAAAEARLARLKERQGKAAQLRAEFGYFGNDESVIRQHYDALNAAAAEVNRRIIAEREQKRQDEERFVTEAFNGPSNKILRRWLKDRPATYERVKRFYDERPNLYRVALPQEQPVKKAA